MLAVKLVGDVKILELRRPERHNALDVDLCDRVRHVVAETADQQTRAIVITGAGRSFCSGADLDGVSGDGFRTALYGALAAITACAIPVVAAINGPAIGAGAQLAIACDLRIGDERARFGVPTARLGLAVDRWTIRRLALLAGGGPARFLLLGDGQIDRARAYDVGLLDRLGTLDDAIGWATEITALAPLTLAYNKRALDELMEPAVDLPVVDAMFERCWHSEDFAEGRAARDAKRSPRFVGR